MNNRINRIIHKLTAAALIAGLIAWQPLPAWRAPASGFAQTAGFTQHAQFIPPFINLVGSQPDFLAGGEQFGYSVAISGDTAVVGAPCDDVLSLTGINAWDQGSAYVYVRNGATWSMQQRLIANDGAAYDGFGSSVAISLNTIVIGAPKNDDLIGSAYVFERNGARWTQQQKLLGPAASAYHYFGRSVAISGDTLVASTASPNDVQIFTRSNGIWSWNQQLTANYFRATYYAPVAISGSTVLVGVPDHKEVSNLSQGAAYVFELDLVSPASTRQQKLTASDGAAGDRFGQSVAISGNTLAVGASWGDNGQGSVYIFTRSATTWNQRPKLTAPESVAADYAGFGASVAINGGTLAVGAPGADVVVNDVTRRAQGSVYVLARSGSNWIHQWKLNASGQWPYSAYDNIRFGSAVALGGALSQTLVVGVPYDLIAYGGWVGPPWFAGLSGSAYVFVR